MDLAALAAELAAEHPDTGPYSPDAEVAADQLNAVNRIVDRVSMTGSEVVNAVDPAEWAGLTTDKQRAFWDIVHIGEINPFGVEATLITSVFGGGSATITALQAARTGEMSRAQELGLGVVKPGHVEQSRAI